MINVFLIAIDLLRRVRILILNFFDFRDWTAIAAILLPFVLFPDINVLAEEGSQTEVYLGITATTVSRVEEPVREASGSVSVMTEPEIQVLNQWSILACPAI